MVMYFISVGLFSLLSQIILLRELVFWLGGDELFYALGLGFWLFLAGLGSIFGRCLKNIFKNISAFMLLSLYAFLPSILVVSLRYILSRILPVGQIPGFGSSIIVIFLALLIPASLAGWLFYLGTRKWPDSTRGYLWETIGFFTAGLIFTFILSRTSFPLPNKINEATLRWRYPNLEKVIYSKGSQLIVSQQDSQKSIFSAGGLIYNSQGNDFADLAGRMFSHLEFEKGKTIILGEWHLAKELSWWTNHGPVTYLQPERKVALEQGGFYNQDLKIKAVELNKFLKNQDDWNWIILSPGTPQTLAGNRYYTLGNLKFVKENLASDGSCALVFDLPVDYQSQEALQFGRVIYNTFDKVFKNIDLLVVEGRVVLIGSEAEINYNLRDSSGLVEMVLEDSRREELKQKLSGGSQINTNRHPLAYFRHHLFWQTMFSFQLPKLFRHLILLIPISLVLILLDMARKLDKSKKLGLLVGISGFSLMGLETVLLFMFQTQFGNLYTYLGLIMGTVLLGLSLGVVIAENVKHPPKVGTFSRASKFKLKNLLFCYLPLGGLLFLDFWQGSILIWLLLALLIGLVGGMVFAIANQFWLKKSDNQTFIYACDLFGSFFGAVLTSTVLLPKFGLPIFLLILAVIMLLPHTGDGEGAEVG